MSWVRIDDGFLEHPKVIALGNEAPEAVLLYLGGLIYASRALTDGLIPHGILPRLAPLPAAVARRRAAALVRVRLWKEDAGGYLVHDYLDYQPSAAEVLEKRRREREKKQRQRGRPEGSPRGTVAERPRGTTEGTDELRPRGTTEGSPAGSPATPIPSHPRDGDTSPLSPPAGDEWLDLLIDLAAGIDRGQMPSPRFVRQLGRWEEEFGGKPLVDEVVAAMQRDERDPWKAAVETLGASQPKKGRALTPRRSGRSNGKYAAITVRDEGGEA